MKTSRLLAVSLGAIAAASLTIPLFAQDGPDSGPVEVRGARDSVGVFPVSAHPAA